MPNKFDDMLGRVKNSVWLLVILIGIVFSAGVNWSQISSTTTQVDSLKTKVQKNQDSIIVIEKGMIEQRVILENNKEALDRVEKSLEKIIDSLLRDN